MYIFSSLLQNVGGGEHEETVAHVQREPRRETEREITRACNADTVRAAHDICWTVVMDGIVKQGEEKRRIGE